MLLLNVNQWRMLPSNVGMSSLGNLIILLSSAGSVVIMSDRWLDSQFLQCKTYVKEQFVDIDYGGFDESIELLMSA